MDDKKALWRLARNFAQQQCLSRDIKTEVLHMLVVKFIAAHPEATTNQKAAIADACAHYGLKPRVVKYILAEASLDATEPESLHQTLLDF